MARHSVKGAIVLGMLLLIPGLWGILVLVGVPVPMSGGTGTGGISSNVMAAIMLVCIPVAAALIWGAVFFHKQHQKYDAMVAAQAEE